LVYAFLFSKKKSPFTFGRRRPSLKVKRENRESGVMVFGREEPIAPV